MLLKEILLNANLLVPNSINDEVKVGWLNNIQGQLYRDFAFPNTSINFIAETGVSLYPLPINCSRERITSVIVDETDYEYRTIDQDVSGYCWTIIENNLLIQPTPIKDVSAYLNYRPSPPNMRIDMQNEEPGFPVDFHEILVYGIAVRIARSLQAMDLAAHLKVAFDELHESAQRELRGARNKKTQTNRTWR